jgi:hypothetical protein
MAFFQLGKSHFCWMMSLTNNDGKIGRAGSPPPAERVDLQTAARTGQRAPPARRRPEVRRPSAAFKAASPLKKLQNLLPDFASIGNK